MRHAPALKQSQERTSPPLSSRLQPRNEDVAAAFDELPGIGADLAGKIQELLSTGRLRALDKLRARVPVSLRELLALPSMGPVRVRALHTIGVGSIDDLRKALDKNRLKGLHGFGAVPQDRLRAALGAKASESKRWLWSMAAQYAQPLRASRRC